MTDERYRFEALRDMLRRPDRDPAVLAVFGAAAINEIEREDHYGHLELQAEGFDVVFQKAPFVVAAAQISDPDELLIAGFHFRREGHDGFAEYSLALPGGIVFGDTSDIVRSKLGDPERVGGGTYVPLLKHNTQAIFIETDKNADPSDPFPPVLISEMNLRELIDASTIEDICANVRDQVSSYDAEDLLRALNFYLEHDAFMDAEQSGHGRRLQCGPIAPPWTSATSSTDGRND